MNSARSHLATLQMGPDRASLWHAPPRWNAHRRRVQPRSHQAGRVLGKLSGRTTSLSDVRTSKVFHPPCLNWESIRHTKSASSAYPIANSDDILCQLWPRHAFCGKIIGTQRFAGAARRSKRWLMFGVVQPPPRGAPPSICLGNGQ